MILRGCALLLLASVVACSDNDVDDSGTGGTIDHAGGDTAEGGRDGGDGGAPGGGGGMDGEGGSGEGGAGGTIHSAIGCEGSSAFLCDDFESGDIDSARWNATTNNGGTIGVSSDVTREGNYALHVHLPSANGANGLLRPQSAVFPLDDNQHFGRAWIFVDTEVPNTHSKLIGASGMLDGSFAHYRLDANGGDLNSRYTTPYINDNVQHGGLRKFGYEMPADTWLCVEWHYDGVSHEMRYWFDGIAQDEMTVRGSEDPQWTAPTFDRMEIGWHTYQAGAANGYDIYYDGIVIDDERVGCGRD